MSAVRLWDCSAHFSGNVRVAGRLPVTCKSTEGPDGGLLGHSKIRPKEAVVKRALFSALILVVTGAVIGLGAHQDWKGQLKAKLEGVYTPSKLAKPGILQRRVGGGRDDRIVKEEGAVLVIQKPGILAGGGSYGMIRKSTVENGSLTKIHRQADSGQYLFKPGDRVYVQSIHVDNDSFALRIMNAEPVERVRGGNTESEQFVAHVEFKFDKAYLPTAEFADLQKVVGEFLATAEQATAAKTIALGQTMAEVKAILGEPTNVVDLGAKKTFVYPNMKVVFVDDKVVDVQ